MQSNKFCAALGLEVWLATVHGHDDIDDNAGEDDDNHDADGDYGDYGNNDDTYGG